MINERLGGKQKCCFEIRKNFFFDLFKVSLKSFTGIRTIKR